MQKSLVMVIGLVVGWLWFTLCAVYQLGGNALDQWPIRLVIQLSIVIWHYLPNPPSPLPWFLGSIGVALLFLSPVGSDNWLRDVGCAIGAAVVAYLIIHVGRTRLPPAWRATLAPYRTIAAYALTLLVFWLVISLCDLGIFKQGLPLHPERFATLRQQSPWSEVHVGVALSGGGYRAALMHAGVLHMLDVLRVPVTHLSTVSGGSIIGGFYAVGGQPADFAAAMRRRHFNLKRALLYAQNLLRLPCPARVPGTDVYMLPRGCSFSRSDVQAALLNALLFHDKKFSALGEHAAPQLLVCATDLYSGRAVGLMRNGVLAQAVPDPQERIEFRLFTENIQDKAVTFMGAEPQQFPGTERLARVVATSGAFPLAFASFSYVSVDSTRKEERKWLLADGGLSDNSGMALLLAAHDHSQDPGLEPWKMDLVLSSDASALFRETQELNPDTHFLRAIDVMYTAVGMVPRRFTHKPPPVLLLSPARLVGRDEQRAKNQKLEIQKQLGIVMPHLSEGALETLVGALPREQRKQARVILERLPDEPQLVNEASLYSDLVPILADDVVRCVSTFLLTSTLEDQLASETVRSLFRLGQYLVVLNHPQLMSVLAARGTSNRPASVAESPKWEH